MLATSQLERVPLLCTPGRGSSTLKLAILSIHQGTFDRHWLAGDIFPLLWIIVSLASAKLHGTNEPKWRNQTASKL